MLYGQKINEGTFMITVIIITTCVLPFISAFRSLSSGLRPAVDQLTSSNRQAPEGISTDVRYLMVFTEIGIQ